MVLLLICSKVGAYDGIPWWEFDYEGKGDGIFVSLIIGVSNFWILSFFGESGSTDIDRLPELLSLFFLTGGSGAGFSL